MITRTPSMLTSEISLLDVPNPAELAETIITWLRDSGFATVPADSSDTSACSGVSSGPVIGAAPFTPSC
jgi:hypothetical protein